MVSCTSPFNLHERCNLRGVEPRVWGQLSFIRTLFHVFHPVGNGADSTSFPFIRSTSNMNGRRLKRFSLRSATRTYQCCIKHSRAWWIGEDQELNMSVSKLMKGSAFSAMAAVMALTALPATAYAKEGRDARASEKAQQRSENRQQRNQSNYAERVTQNRGAERQGKVWDRSERRSETADNRSGRDWNRSERRAENNQNRTTREWSESNRREARHGDDTRNRSYSDRNRNTTYRDGYRDGRWADRRDDRRNTRHAYRDGYRDGRHYDRHRDYNRGDYHRWDRKKWRNHSRYNWHDYRRKHRDIYRLGRYYSPYHHHNYSRISIGIYLDSLFFGSRYWINDPWQYRLPDVYGPYRWVRYYDDALLVNTYTGEVVDVVYDFFW